MLFKECTVSLIPGLSERQQGKEIFSFRKKLVFICNMLLDDSV